eukprot:SAG31_NODE_3377_length_4345_cov_2.113048_2_plen_45_part_00
MPSHRGADVENPIIAIGYLSIMQALLGQVAGAAPATSPQRACIM